MKQVVEQKSRKSRVVDWVKRTAGPASFQFTVFISLASLVVELTSGLCASMIDFDPIPTIWHIAAVASVPLVLGFWGRARRRGDAASPSWRLALGVITGISAVYVFPFLPILPLAMILVLVGVGFLALAPLMSAIAGFVALWKTGRDMEWRGWWGTGGVVMGLVLMTGLAYPSIQLDRAVELLESDEVAARDDAVQILRGVDQELVEERLCSFRRVAHPNPISPFSNFAQGSRGSVAPEHFWRVSGERCPHGWWSSGMRVVENSSDQRGLSLVASRLDSSVDTVAATAYTEWLYEVRNDSHGQGEADFLMQLPPGAVVSRVTLWVNGEPREATFAGRGKAEKAYKTVVSRSRDPILVTSVAPDRIRVRMFPVPAGQTMKARIGLSQPLELESDGDSRMQFPHVIAGNIDAATDHQVWVEAKDPISTSQLEGFTEEEGEPGVHRVRGSVPSDGLEGLEVDMERPPASQVWAADGDAWVVQKAGLLEPDEFGHVIVVLDGGRGMSEHAAAVADAFDRLKAEAVTLIVAGDKVEVVFEKEPADRARAALRDFVDGYEFVGGRDNMPALRKALAVHSSGDEIVWIHAAQPVSLETILHVPERDRQRVWELQVDGGRDINADELHEAGLLEGVPRRGEPASDLGVWFAARSNPTWRTERWFTDDEPVHGKETSRHLARIAANSLVFEKMREGDVAGATEIAARYQLVTPVSAAIVLESQGQYDEFGLERATGSGVPSIPEPHEWALMIIGALALGGAMWRRRVRLMDEARERSVVLGGV